MINGAHLHLMLNHFPLTGLVFSVLVLAYAILRRDERSTRVGLALIVLSGIFAVATYLTGEPAEDAIEHLPSFSESLVEAHEDAAEVAIWLIAATAIVAAAALYSLEKKLEASKLLMMAAAALNVVALVAIARVNNLGGKISHPEIRTSETKDESS